MKIALGLIILLFFVQFSSGQIEYSDAFSYSTSKPYPVVSSYYRSYFNMADGHVISLKYSDHHYVFQKYGDDHLEEELRTDLPKVPSGSSSWGFYKIQDKIYRLYSTRDFSETNEKLIAQELDWHLGEFISEQELFNIAIPEKVIVSKKNKSNDITSFKVTLNQDESKFSISHCASTNDGTTSLFFHTFTHDLVKVNEGSAELPYIYKSTFEGTHFLDSDANFYAFIDSEAKNRRKELKPKDELITNYQLVRIDGKNNSLKTIPIRLKEGNTIIDFKVRENTEGEIVMDGYYSSDKSILLTGFFNIHFSKIGEILFNSSTEFSKETIIEYQRAWNYTEFIKENRNQQLGFRNLVLREVISYSDGSFLMIGEISLGGTNWQSHIGTGDIASSYLSNEEAILCKMDSNGTLLWMKILPKVQHSNAQFPNFWGFNLVAGDEYTYLVIMENIANKTLKSGKPLILSDYNRDYVTAFQVKNETGELKKMYIFYTQDLDGLNLYQYGVDRFVQLDDNEFALEFYIKDKKDVMVRVKFEDK